MQKFQSKIKLVIRGQFVYYVQQNSLQIWLYSKYNL